jgi:hypothetical protein
LRGGVEAADDQVVPDILGVACEEVAGSRPAEGDEVDEDDEDDAVGREEPREIAPRQRRLEVVHPKGGRGAEKLVHAGGVVGELVPVHVQLRVTARRRKPKGTGGTSQYGSVVRRNGT